MILITMLYNQQFQTRIYNQRRISSSKPTTQNSTNHWIYQPRWFVLDRVPLNKWVPRLVLDLQNVLVAGGSRSRYIWGCGIFIVELVGLANHVLYL